MSIMYLGGDATYPIGEGAKIIAHVCNDKMLWGKGFVLAISKRWKMPERVYTTWEPQRYNPDGSPKKRGDLSLGSVQLVAVEPNLWVANMIGQHDIVPENGLPPVRYEAIRTALQFVAQDAEHFKASIHMPRIGCGLAGGKWNIVESLIKETLSELDVFVYDYTDTASSSYVPPQ